MLLPAKLYAKSEMERLHCQPAELRFLWNTESVDLANIIKQISKLTCKNYLVPLNIKNIHGISIMIEEPIDVLEAEEIFISILRTNNLKRVKGRGFYKIIAAGDQHEDSIPLDRSSQVTKETPQERIAFSVYLIKNRSPEAVHAFAKTFLGNLGKIDFMNKKYILIRDTASNIDAILKNIKNFDTPKNYKIMYIKLKYAKTAYISKIFNKLKKEGFFLNYTNSTNSIKSFNSIQGSPKDGRTSENQRKEIIYAINRVLFIKGNNLFFRRIINIVKYLDVRQNDSKSNKIKIYNIYNGRAVNVSHIISNIFSNNSLFNYNKKVFISVHDESNSIIVCTSSKSLKIIGKLIHQIDRNKHQIYIKASILDVSTTSSYELNWDFLNNIAYKKNSNSMSCIVANSSGQSLRKNSTETKKNVSSQADLLDMSEIVGNIGVKIPYLKISNNVLVSNIISVFKANENYSDINIIASPSLTTMDHHKAEISVGERIPIIGALSNQGNSAKNSSVSIPHIKYEDVILKFIVQPHVKKNKSIYMEIEQENNEIGESIPLFNNFTQNSIKTKKIRTSVCIMDKQTIIIGGLLNEKTIKTEKNIPILSDIPILGHFFQDQKNIKRKSNLVLMVTPTIIKNKNSYNSKYKIKSINNFIKN